MNEVQVLEKLQSLSQQVEVDYAIWQSKFKHIEELQAEDKSIRLELNELNLLQAYLNKIVDSRRKETVDKVLGLVTYGLQTILKDSTISLKLSEKVLRNQKFFTFILNQDGRESELVNSVGGGILNLVSFLLRVVFIAVSSNRKFLILDEPFAALSKNYRENIGEFLKYLAEKTNVQILTVSHQEEIDAAADKLYVLKLKDGKLTVVKH